MTTLPPLPYPDVEVVVPAGVDASGLVEALGGRLPGDPAVRACVAAVLDTDPGLRDRVVAAGVVDGADLEVVFDVSARCQQRVVFAPLVVDAAVERVGPLDAAAEACLIDGLLSLSPGEFDALVDAAVVGEPVGVERAVEWLEAIYGECGL